MLRCWQILIKDPFKKYFWDIYAYAYSSKNNLIWFLILLFYFSFSSGLSTFEKYFNSPRDFEQSNRHKIVNNYSIEFFEFM